jgi:hypothetical protein
MTELTRNAGRIVTNLMELTSLYAGVFVVQVILLPLGVLWLLGSLAGRLIGGERSGWSEPATREVNRPAP